MLGSGSETPQLETLVGGCCSEVSPGKHCQIHVLLLLLGVVLPYFYKLFSPIGVALKGSNAIKAVADVPDVVPGRVLEGSGRFREGSCLLG